MSIYRRRVAEILLNEAGLASRSGESAKDALNLLIINLIWPRPAIVERTAARFLPIEGAKRLDLSDSEWVDRILFKETVQGPFALQASVTEPLKGERIGEAMDILGKFALRFARDTAGDIVGGGIPGRLAEVPFEGIAGLLKSGNFGHAEIVASGSVGLCADADWAEGDLRYIKVPLCVPRNVYAVNRTEEHGESRVQRKVALEKGQNNGFVLLSMRMYN